MFDALLRIGFLPMSLLFVVALSVIFSSAEGFAFVSSCISCSSSSSLTSSMFLAQPWSGGHSAARKPRGSFSGGMSREYGDRARSCRRGGAANGMQMMDAPAKKGKGPYKVIANNKWVPLVFK